MNPYAMVSGLVTNWDNSANICKKNSD